VFAPNVEDFNDKGLREMIAQPLLFMASMCGARRSPVIACDKREAFAQGSEATKQSIYLRAARWIASRSLSSGAHSRDPLARNDGALRST
jgi:hypothetical protein